MERIGQKHQAGSDSLLTAQVFFKLVDMRFGGMAQLDRDKYNCELFGYGNNNTVYRPGHMSSSVVNATPTKGSGGHNSHSTSAAVARHAAAREEASNAATTGSNSNANSSNVTSSSSSAGSAAAAAPHNTAVAYAITSNSNGAANLSAAFVANGVIAVNAVNAPAGATVIEDELLLPPIPLTEEFED